MGRIKKYLFVFSGGIVTLFSLYILFATAFLPDVIRDKNSHMLTVNAGYSTNDVTLQDFDNLLIPQSLDPVVNVTGMFQFSKTFTLKNHLSDTGIQYYIYLETKDGQDGVIPDDSMCVGINGTSLCLTSSEASNPFTTGYNKSYLIGEGYILNSRVFNISAWVSSNYNTLDITGLDWQGRLTIRYAQKNVPVYEETTLSSTKFKEFLSTTSSVLNIVTVDSGCVEGTDVGEDEGHIYAWQDGMNVYISVKDPGYMIKMPEDCTDFFSSITFTGGYADFSFLDTSSVINMVRVFKNYIPTDGYKMAIVVGLDNWDTSNVTDMSEMFSGTGASPKTPKNVLISGLESWNVSSVTNMASMFYQSGYGASAQYKFYSIGDLSNWDVSSVTDMNKMFYYAGRFATNFEIVGLDNWDVSNVTDMSYMFAYAGYWTSNTWSIGDLSEWDVSNVTNMSGMFCYAGYRAPTFNQNLSSWNVSNVTNMASMFRHAGYNATTFNLDLSGWNVANVTNMASMFYYTGSHIASDDWHVTIPSMTGTTNNDTTHFYGSGTNYASPDSGKYFTLAS